MRYLKYFESHKVGITISIIKDLLIDLSDNGFHVTIEVVGRENDHMTDDDIYENEGFRVDIITDRAYRSRYDEDGSDIIGDDIDDVFTWEEVRTSIDQLISYVSDKYKLELCQANIIDDSDYYYYDIVLGSYNPVGKIDVIYVEGDHEGHRTKIGTEEKIISELDIRFKPIKR